MRFRAENLIGQGPSYDADVYCEGWPIGSVTNKEGVKTFKHPSSPGYITVTTRLRQTRVVFPDGAVETLDRSKRRSNIHRHYHVIHTS